MRLNRVLQMTAAIGMTVAATIFTISCGEDGAEGKPGTGCEVRGTDPYRVFCNGEDKGPLLSGVNPGQAPNGQTGPRGQGCNAVPNGNFISLDCGGESVTLDACDATSSGRQTIIRCGSTTVGLCDVEVFDPSKEYCPVTSGAVSSINTVCGPDEAKYNPQEEYCGFTSEAEIEEGIPVVLPLCAAKVPITASASNKPNEAELNSAGDKWVLKTANAANKGKEYCEVTRALKTGGSLAKEGDVEETMALGTPIICGADTVKINENEWKGEYCGYASASSSAKSILTDACGTGAGPSEQAYGKKYCSMKAINHKYTDTTGTRCLQGTITTVSSSSTSATVTYTDTSSVTLNRLDNKQTTVLSETDYLKQYCGYEDASAISSITSGSTTTTVIKQSRLTGSLCDYDASGLNPASVGPNALQTGTPTWRNEYCQGIKASGKTKLVGVSTSTYRDNVGVYCIPDTAGTTTVLTAGPEARINEGRWSDEYCAYSDKTDLSKFAIEDGTCDYDGSGSASSVGPNAVETSGTASWKNEFCQAIKDKPGKTKIVGITGTTYYANKDVYCVADTSTSYTASIGGNFPPEARLNAGNEWKDQYCGFARAADMTSSPKVLSILTGTCDYDSSGTLSGIKAPNAVGTTTWAAQYCQARTKDNDSTTVVGLISSASTWTDLVKIYCPGDTTGLTVQRVADSLLALDASSLEAITINKGKWNNEYCGFESRADFSVLKDPSSDYNSTSNPRVGKFSRLTGTCDKPSTGSFTAATRWVGPNAATLAAGGGTTAWPNQYCKVMDRSSPKTTISKSQKDDMYCVDDETDWRDAGSDKRLNEGTWKGQYCFADNAISTCSGGLVGNTSKKSTDSDKCTR